MNDTPTTKGRKPRRRVTTDLGRQLIQKEKNRLAKEQALIGERMVREAQTKLERRRTTHRQVTTAEIAVVRGIVKRFAGALASEGVTVRISTKPAAKVSAWTDFDSITINYVLDDDVRLMAATLRGLGYHEGGHCRWTIPFLDLAAMLHLNGQGLKEYHHAWNLLEDQRMETAVVSDSPRKAVYFTVMVMDEMCDTPEKLLANWPLLIWRRYMPKAVRAVARALWVAQVTADGKDGEALARRFENCVTTYVLADNAQVMWDQVVEMHSLLQEVQVAGLDDGAMGHSNHSRPNYNPNPQPKRPNEDKLDIPVSPDMEKDSDGEGDDADEGEPSAEGKGKGKADDESDKDEDGQGQGQGAGDDDDEPESDDEGLTYANEDREEDGAGEKGHHVNKGIREGLDYQDVKDLLQEAKDEAHSERDSDRALDSDVQAFSDALHEQVSRQVPYMTGPSANVEAQAVAENLARDLEESFQAATIDFAPAWVEGTRRGIVNVLRYETRRPGDVEYFKAWQDDEQPGFNLSVSVLLDYSGSMSGATLELAQAGYATKAACTKLGIPCTVTLWDDSATTLWDANETPEYLPIIVANGGTDPRYALADLDNQQLDKEHHLVMIMTDGAWSGNSNVGMLGAYSAEGRVFLGVAYNCGSDMGNTMRSYGCQEAWVIENLMDIPRTVMNTLEAWATA